MENPLSTALVAKNLPLRFVNRIRATGQTLTISVLLPVFAKCKETITQWKRSLLKEESPLPDWKNKAIDDFRNWLKDMPEEPTSDKEDALPMESADLFTVLKEFAALRQEIKLQNREQNRAVKTLTTFIEDYKDTADLFRDRTTQLAGLEERIRLSCEKNTAIHFFDIRDALIRGRKAASAIIGKKSLFMSKEKYEGLKEGYEMAIRRFDRALSSLGIEPIETEGKKFNPETMRALGSASQKGIEPGVVVEEHRSGFIRNKEILRTADVIVNK